MNDAAVEVISDDLRFYAIFNAILALAATALRASGYRTASQQGHHTRVIETLAFTLDLDAKTVYKLLAFSKKRNSVSYDSAGSVSRQDLEQILAAAEDLRHRVDAWLQTAHPELL